MKILIVYDGSDEANTSLDALAGSSLPFDAEALVLAPVEVWPPLPESCFRHQAGHASRLLRKAHDLARTAVAQALRTAAEGAQRVKRRFPDWAVHIGTCLDCTPAGLLKKAENWGADRLLVSTQCAGAEAQAGNTVAGRMHRTSAR